MHIGISQKEKILTYLTDYIILLSTFPGMMLWIFVNGLVKGSPQEKSGSMLLEAGLNKKSIHGATNCIRTESIIVIYGKEIFPKQIHWKTVIWALLQLIRSPLTAMGYIIYQEMCGNGKIG